MTSVLTALPWCLVLVVVVGWALADTRRDHAVLESDGLARDNTRLRKAVSSLIHDRDRYAARALRAEQRVQELWMEHCEDAAYRRELDEWKRDMDPRIANAPEWKLRQIVDDLFAPVKPSPASYVADPFKEFVGRVGGLEVDE